MEELVLTDPEVKPEEVKNKYKVVLFSMDHETIGVTLPPPAISEPGVVTINLKDNLGGYFTHKYTGKTATDFIKFVNTGNFTTTSLHKRILQRLSNDGVLPGTVTGTPDPPAGVYDAGTAEGTTETGNNA
jgi:hypothetical protein